MCLVASRGGSDKKDITLEVLSKYLAEDHSYLHEDDSQCRYEKQC